MARDCRPCRFCGCKSPQMSRCCAPRRGRRWGSGRRSRRPSRAVCSVGTPCPHRCRAPRSRAGSATRSRAECAARSAWCAVRGAQCAVRGARCAVRVVRCGVRVQSVGGAHRYDPLVHARADDLPGHLHVVRQPQGRVRCQAEDEAEGIGGEARVGGRRRVPRAFRHGSGDTATREEDV